MPLAAVEVSVPGPGIGLTMTPVQARDLAVTLLRLAAEADALA